VNAQPIAEIETLDPKTQHWLRWWADYRESLGRLARKVSVRAVSKVEHRATQYGTSLVAFDISAGSLRPMGSVAAVDVSAGPSGVVASIYKPGPIAKLEAQGMDVQDRSLCPKWWTIETLPGNPPSVVPGNPQFQALEWISPLGTADQPQAPPEICDIVKRYGSSIRVYFDSDRVYVSIDAARWRESAIALALYLQACLPPASPASP
jgi:hypothetical protein